MRDWWLDVYERLQFLGEIYGDLTFEEWKAVVADSFYNSLDDEAEDSAYPMEGVSAAQTDNWGMDEVVF